MNILKWIVKVLIPKRLTYFLVREEINKNPDLLAYGRVSYSQEGEDLLLCNFLDVKRPGFYVDVGAHDPVRFSNTLFFYQRGWTGINIDANSESIIKFQEMRPKDVNINCGIGLNEIKRKYYRYAEPALNTFSEEVVEYRKGHQKKEPLSVEILKIQRLDNILNQYTDRFEKIEFLTIDVEGLDLEVLQSNSWDLYRPRMILIEDLDRKDLSFIHESKVVKYLKDKQYSPLSRLNRSILFKSDQEEG